MRWRLAWSKFTRVLFVVYCVEAGLFLALAPWRQFWLLLVERSAFAQANLEWLLVQPWARGAVSGFGLVHLVWGAHDLERLVRGSRAPVLRAGRRQDAVRQREQAAPSTGPARDQRPKTLRRR